MAIFADSPEEAWRRRDRTVAVSFFLLSLVIMYLPAGTQGELAAVLRATALRPFLFTQESLVQIRLHAEETEVLQARIDSLTALVVTQAPLVQENRHLHELLGLWERAPSVFLPASVIRPGTPGSESVFLLDVGSERGVQPEDPVIMTEGQIGLVGKITQVRGGSSIGMDWSHPDFRVSASTADGRVFGIVQPWRGPFREQDRLILNGTPYHETLEAGTLITTSGLGGVFPRGIPVGIVEGVQEEEGGWRKSYWLRPVVEKGSVTHALVVRGDEAPEVIMELFREGGSGSGGDTQGGGEPSPSAPGRIR